MHEDAAADEVQLDLSLLQARSPATRMKRSGNTGKRGKKAEQT
jgi:hypothetical protein